MTKSAVVIYSGGMDSYTLLRHALEEGYTVHALSFDYGQRHRRELDAARITCALLSLGQEGSPVQHTICDMTFLADLLHSALTPNSALDVVPEGHYAEPSMKATVVPNRNMIMLSVAAGVALSEGAGVVYYGAHSGDHAIYPDCRPEFVEAMSAAVNAGNYGNVIIAAPFLHMDKGAILAHGLARGWDYSNTWTCYNGGNVACGKCGACTERLEAFAYCGVVDPLEYAHE